MDSTVWIAHSKTDLAVTINKYPAFQQQRPILRLMLIPTRDIPGDPRDGLAMIAPAEGGKVEKGIG